MRGSAPRRGGQPDRVGGDWRQRQREKQSLGQTQRNRKADRQTDTEAEIDAWRDREKQRETWKERDRNRDGWKDRHTDPGQRFRERRTQRGVLHRSSERHRQAGAPPPACTPPPRTPQLMTSTGQEATRRLALARGPLPLPLSYSCLEHLGWPVLGPRSQRLVRPALAQSPRAQPRATCTLSTSENT